MEKKELLKNRAYRRIGSVTGESFNLVNYDDNLIYFDNGAQVSKDVFLSSFELVPDTSTHIDQTQQTNESYNTNYNTSYNLDNDDYLKELFKNNGGVSDNLLSSVDKIMRGESVGGPTRREETSSFVIKGPNDEVVGRQQFGHTQSVPRLADSQLDNNNLPEHRRMINKKLNPEDYEDYDEQPIVKSKKISEYDKVKLSQVVKLPVNIEIDLPTKEHIEVIRDMFEDNEIDYVEYMIDKYIDEHIKNNTDMLKELFVDSINKWINGEVEVISEPFTEKKKEEKSDTEIELKTDRENYYDGIDYSKVFSIENDVELTSVKNKIEQLEKTNSKEDRELLDHLKNLVDEYEN